MKVLIIQVRQLGDVLLSTPLAEAIKYEKPEYEVHFLTSDTAYDIVSENPYIDKILALKKGIANEIKTIKNVISEHYDAIIDVQRTGRSKRITLFSFAKTKVAFKRPKENFYYNTLIEYKARGYTVFDRMALLKGIGINTKKKFMPKLFFFKEDMQKVEEYLKTERIGKFFIVAPTVRQTKNRIRQIMPISELGKLTGLLEQKTGLKPIVVYGVESERSIAVEVGKYAKNAHVIKKPFSIKEFAALANLSSFFIGHNSFPAHVSVSQNAKTVVICGPKRGWFVENKNTFLVYKGLPCQPCNSPESCTLNLLCYTSLKSDEVFKKISPFLFYSSS